MSEPSKPDGEPVVWLRPGLASREPRAPRPSLDREAITGAAIALADADGLEAVSMRRIAAKLGAGATSLYWYVSSKEDLYELMLDEVMREIALPSKPSDDWRSDLGAIARETHAVLGRHKWTVLLGIQPGLGPNAQAWDRAALRALAGQRIDQTIQINILAMLFNYIFGFIHRELAWDKLWQGVSAGEAEWARQARAADRELGRQLFVPLDLHGEASFEFGLECLLDGVAARLASTDTVA